MSDIDNNKLTNYLRLKKMTHLRKELSFIDLLFLSLGGQAPFLSLLTYATSVIIYSLLFSPIVVLLGTLIVLLNGLVVFKLSRKYEETGGYYIYAMYSLTRRLGLETGWMYIFYSSFYGTAYLVGSSFVLHYVFGFSPILALFVSIIPASVFLLMGLRPSAKYAEISGVVEILIIVAVFFVGIYLAHFRFYNPLQRVPSISDISLAILFAIGIPTGYGSITPLSGETINTKDVGKAILYVIIIGGFVASLGVYGLIDMGLYTNQLSIIFKSSIPILDIMKSNLGIYSIIIMIYAAISDGILASLSFMLGTSRTIYAMAQKDMLPSVFTWLRNNQPIMASLLTIAIYAIISVPSLLVIKNPFYLFLELGAIAGLANLFVHLSANFSLFFSSLKDLRKKAIYKSEKILKRIASFILARLGEIFLSIIGVTFSLFVLLYSLGTVNRIAENLFMGWIIVGFLYAEIVDSIKSTKENNNR